MTDENEKYRETIAALLDHYEDGWDIFKKADGWDYPVRLRPGHEDKNLPKSWVELADRVIGIIAHQKYDLKTYDNIIELVSTDQMLHAMTTTGMPASYDHWSFGKKRIIAEEDYRKRGGKPYELVINSDPALAYCMEDNTKTMQMLVIAHASYGHNSFFKNNCMFRDNTRATEIIDDLVRYRDFVRECEQKHGIKEVEKILDVCHALQLYATDRYKKPPKRTPEEEEQRRRRLRETQEDRYNPVMGGSASGMTEDFRDAGKRKDDEPEEGEENLLRYIAENAPHLKEWERTIMTQFCERAAYFSPQRQTKVMNEGWASFWHHRLMTDLSDMDLIDGGMYQEFLASHAMVLTQYDYNTMIMSPDGPQKLGFRAQFNPYTLGFHVFQDIKRICENPTDEDREYFPKIAGRPWLPTLKDAMEDFKDETFFLQYLSPKLIRDFHMFAVLDDDYEDSIEVEAIHNEAGYRKIRQVIAGQYRLDDMLPDIEAVHVDRRGNRGLTLFHKMHDRIPLDEKDTGEVLKHIYRVWEHPVILHSVAPDGAVVKIMSCPPDKKSRVRALSR